MLKNTDLHEITTKSNAELIAETYYDYHGRHDDGNSPADEYVGLTICTTAPWAVSV